MACKVTLQPYKRCGKSENAVHLSVRQLVVRALQQVADDELHDEKDDGERAGGQLLGLGSVGSWKRLERIGFFCRKWIPSFQQGLVILCYFQIFRLR